MKEFEFLEKKYFDNSVQEYLIVAGIILFGLLVLRLFRKIILKRLAKWAASTETSVDDIVVNSLEKFVLPILNIALIYYAIIYLNLSEKVTKYMGYAITAIIAYFIIRIATSSVQQLLHSYVLKQENGEQKIKQINGIIIVINVVIWAVGLLFLFHNLGYNVTAIVAGLGIGGIAIALAAQNILGDLFNYFVIFFDQPFEIGDFIVVDDKKGAIEYIGVKTTRIRSLSGEQLIIPNSDLTNSRVHNFKRLESRRTVFTFGIVYNTPIEKIRAVPGLIKQIVEEQSNAKFDRAHFASYGSFSLNYEVVYFVGSPEYNEFMDIQQTINFRIFEEFKKREIEFAYPTQTLLMNKLVE